MQENTSKYLVAEGWSHIFEGFGERVVRFVFDTTTKKIVFMEMETGLGWLPTTSAQREDVTDSLINANEDALEDPEEFDLEAADALPGWASV